MTDSEKLDLLLCNMQSLNDDMQFLKGETKFLREETKFLKEETKFLKEEVQETKEELQAVRQKVTVIEMTLENEVTVNIMRVAEGHLDLSRNLGEVKRSFESLDRKMEMNDIFIRHHDSEIKKLNILVNC